jgi:drug/metabolite transporter (DMT)-like permease
MRAEDWARLLLLASIWGSSFLFIKVALDDLSPLGIAAVRLVLGAAVLVAFLWSRGRRRWIATAPWKRLSFMAVVGNVLPFILIPWGEERITSSLAAILNSTTPLFTAAIAAALIPSERPSALRVGGIVLGFAGVAVIVGVDVRAGQLLGELAIVLASLSYAVGFVYARRRLTGRELSSLELSAAQLMMSSAIALPLAGLDAVVRPPTPSLPGTLAMAALGMLGTGFAYVLLYRLLTDVGPTTASFVTYLFPVFGVALGWLVLDERIGWNTVVGAALVIGGIAVAERAAAARQPAVR